MNKVNGLIIVTNDYITSNTSYSQPKIISLVDYITGAAIYKYALTETKG